MPRAVTTFYAGQQVRWREDTHARKWHVGFVVGARNQWVIVRLANGTELEVHPLNVRMAPE